MPSTVLSALYTLTDFVSVIVLRIVQFLILIFVMKKRKHSVVNVARGHTVNEWQS